jgi:hypothetical protein
MAASDPHNGPGGIIEVCAKLNGLHNVPFRLCQGGAQRGRMTLHPR